MSGLRPRDRGKQENGGLEPLAQYGEEGHRRQCDPAPLPQRRIGVALDLALQPCGVAGHPEHHQRHEDDRDRRDHAFELFLRTMRKRGLDQREPRANTDGQRHGGSDAKPHLGQTFAPGAQEGRNDPDDQRRLETFAQADDECCQHAVGTPSIPE